MRRRAGQIERRLQRGIQDAIANGVQRDSVSERLPIWENQYADLGATGRFSAARGLLLALDTVEFVEYPSSVFRADNRRDTARCVLPLPRGRTGIGGYPVQLVRLVPCDWDTQTPCHSLSTPDPTWRPNTRDSTRPLDRCYLQQATVQGQTSQMRLTISHICQHGYMAHQQGDSYGSVSNQYQILQDPHTFSRYAGLLAQAANFIHTGLGDEGQNRSQLGLLQNHIDRWQREQDAEQEEEEQEAPGLPTNLYVPGRTLRVYNVGSYTITPQDMVVACSGSYQPAVRGAVVGEEAVGWALDTIASGQVGRIRVEQQPRRWYDPVLQGAFQSGQARQDPQPSPWGQAEDMARTALDSNPEPDQLRRSTVEILQEMIQGNVSAEEAARRINTRGQQRWTWGSCVQDHSPPTRIVSGSEPLRDPFATPPRFRVIRRGCVLPSVLQRLERDGEVELTFQERGMQLNVLRSPELGGLRGDAPGILWPNPLRLVLMEGRVGEDWVRVVEATDAPSSD